MHGQGRATGAGLVLALALALMVSAPGAAHAQFPDVDPLKPASCDVKDGWMTVYAQALNGWDKATKSGKFSSQQSTDVSVWLIALLNRIAETNDIKGVCLDIIARRTAENF